MTNEEAIIKLLPITDNMGFTDEFRDACKVAIEALEKQIPMEPNHGMTQRYCPVCCARVINTYKFCDQCGQKLDWGGRTMAKYINADQFRFDLQKHIFYYERKEHGK